MSTQPERTAEHQSVIDVYARTLPEPDFDALDAWLTTFYPFQLDWVLDQSRAAICNKSRQIGLSHASAAFGVMRGAFHGETTTIVSEGDREAKEVLDKAKKHARVLASLGCRMAVPIRDPENQIVFASGGRLIALPSSAGRGFTGNVILDEFAYQDHADQVWDATAAVALLGFMIRVVSTPNGVGNLYEKHWHGIPKDPKLKAWRRHEIPIDLAIAQGYPVDIENCWTLAKGDPRLFDQMFRCKFLDNLAQYIGSDLISLATEDNYIAVAGRKRYAGLDIGETRDRTTLLILEEDDAGVLHLIHMESHRSTDDVLIDNLAAKAFGAFGVRRLAADATGLGSMPAKRMKRQYKQKFEPVKFSPASKEDLATGAYDLFANAQIKIPRTFVPVTSLLTTPAEDEAPLLRDDVCAIRRIVTAAGNVRYDAARTDAGHADRAWSLFLAIHAATKRGGTDKTILSQASSR